MFITLTEAKEWLRIDYDDDDVLINALISTAENLCLNTLRKETSEITDTAITRTAELYAVAYLHEHRENADMEKLTRDIRYILATERKAAF